MKYRVVEQFGYFVIEKEVEVINLQPSFFWRILPWFVPRKEIKTKEWRTVKDNNDKSMIPAYRKSLTFDSFQYACDYIDKIEPKYHDVPEKETKYSDECENCTYCVNHRGSWKCGECDECKKTRIQKRQS